MNRSRRVQRTPARAPQAPLPGHVHAAMNSPATPLDPATAAAMEARLGHDFEQVRIHSGAAAAQSAARLGARAYAVGDDVVLPTASRDPHRLLAHELAHVAQQRVGSTSGDPEPRARAAADAVVRGEAVGAAALGGAATGVHRDPVPPQEERREPHTIGPISLSWDEVWNPPRQRSRVGFGLPQLQVDPALAAGLAPPAAVTPPMGVQRNLVPPARPAAAPAAPSSAPSRVSVVDSGHFSLGVRLGFPAPQTAPGAPPSAAVEGLRRATLLQQQWTGRLPSAWEAVDKGELAGIIWSIFSTHLAPDLAHAISSGLARPKPAGVTFTVDAALLTDFSGAGVSLTVTFP
jgi:hypothetical protein